jgi:hypothetical protein
MLAVGDLLQEGAVVGVGPCTKKLIIKQMDSDMPSTNANCSDDSNV